MLFFSFFIVNFLFWSRTVDQDGYSSVLSAFYALLYRAVVRNDNPSSVNEVCMHVYLTATKFETSNIWVLLDCSYRSNLITLRCSRSRIFWRLNHQPRSISMVEMMLHLHAVVVCRRINTCIYFSLSIVTKRQSNRQHQQNQHTAFYKPDAHPVAQPTVSEHWRMHI